ncbi:hypothetical protein PV327_010621 [Microctonus hyperodae]|uniref:Uncharacterized protein n=1 Tax=Microctonus hyperodae TaxID=165561 RepID=A0AA39KVA4_MICHY|nr:hypothetical protein PV327_010621 [Microctonus hyperodae]
MNNANSLTFASAYETIQLVGQFDGAMSAAPTRGQLPRRQRRHHQRRHHRHLNHRQHLKNNNNNYHLHHHHHHHHLLSHNGHNYHGQYQYISHQQRSHENHYNKLENNDKQINDEINKNEELIEKRPKVNPIFLWALQREQRIIEIRCEDYDKRNRIKLTKTPHGWRSIPRTSSNDYNSCCCFGSNYTQLMKDKPASPSVSSTCVPNLISSNSPSSSSYSSSESMSFSSTSELSNVNTRKNNDEQHKKIKHKKMNTIKTRPQTRNSRYQVSSDYDESDATRSTYRNSQQSCDLSYVYDQIEDIDDVNYKNEYNDYELGDDDDDDDDDNATVVKQKVIDEANEYEKKSRFINSEKPTFKFIDLKKAQNNQSLQPRVVLEPLNTFTILSNSLRERSRLDDEIEMIVEEESEEDEEGNDANKEKIHYVDFKQKNFNESETSLRHQCTKIEDSDDEIEEIEDKDNIDDELIDENATVFEYEDRDSVDMMDNEEFEEHDEILLKPTKLYPPVDLNLGNTVEPQASCLENDIIEEEKEEGEEEQEESEAEEEGEEEVQEEQEEAEEEEEEEEGEKKQQPQQQKKAKEEQEKLLKDPKSNAIYFEQTQLLRNTFQVPDLKPIDSLNDSIEKTTSEFTVKKHQINASCNERLLSSPPCSVTCSEDTSCLENNRNSTIATIRRRREAPDLIEVKPTEWHRRGELLRPAHQLRELIEKSGHIIPDPILVPRDRLPALAASPGVEIPRLLVSRPELRLPEALTHPELLADPDILVISLSHLQQVLDAVQEPIKYRNMEIIDRYVLSNGVSISSGVHSERKRLSVKPIGSLMPAPMDLSRNSTTLPPIENSIFLVQNKYLKQESEITSTARLSGDDSRLWHPLFGCRRKATKQDDVIHEKLISHQNQDRLHQQPRPRNYQEETRQETDRQHRASWHRTTLAS